MKLRFDPVVLIVAILLYWSVYSILDAVVEPTLPPYDTCSCPRVSEEVKK